MLEHVLIGFSSSVVLQNLQNRSMFAKAKFPALIVSCYVVSWTKNIKLH